MYSIDYCDFGPFTLVELSNRETGELFSFLPEFGSTMNQLILRGKNGLNYKILQANEDYEGLITEGKKKFIGSKLFPFPNRIQNGSYEFSSQVYDLPINFPSEGHAIHGLMLEKPFKIKNVKLNEEEGNVLLEYQYNKEIEGYPFKFTLQIIFSLSASGFSCKTIVINDDKKSIPVGDGWHPYFKIGERINDLLIKIPSEEEIEVNEKMIPNGRTRVFDDFREFQKIGTKSFDTCFRLQKGNEKSNVQIWDQESDLKLNVWMESGKDKYQYVQIFTPPTRDCIAIEPMTCIPDAFNNQQGLIIIPKGDTRSFEWGIQLS